jgi:hypothetical protein
VVFAVRFEPGAFFFWLIHQPVFYQKLAGKAKAAAVSSQNLVFRNCRPTVKVRCFGFIAVSLRIILTA